MTTQSQFGINFVANSTSVIAHVERIERALLRIEALARRTSTSTGMALAGLDMTQLQGSLRSARQEYQEFGHVSRRSGIEIAKGISDISPALARSQARISGQGSALVRDEFSYLEAASAQYLGPTSDADTRQLLKQDVGDTRNVARLTEAELLTTREHIARQKLLPKKDQDAALLKRLTKQQRVQEADLLGQRSQTLGAQGTEYSQIRNMTDLQPDQRRYVDSIIRAETPNVLKSQDIDPRSGDYNRAVSGSRNATESLLSLPPEKATQAQGVARLQLREMGLTLDQSTAAVDRNAASWAKQTAQLERNVHTTKKQEKSYGFGVIDRGLGPAQNLAKVGSAAQGAVGALSLMDGNVLNLAFSLIFLQFSMVPIALSMGAITIAAKLAADHILKVSKEVDNIRRLGQQLRFAGHAYGEVATAQEAVMRATKEYNFELADSIKAASLMTGAFGDIEVKLKNGRSLWDLIIDVAADTGRTLEDVASSFLDIIRPTELTAGSFEEFEQAISGIIPVSARGTKNLIELKVANAQWFAQLASSINPMERATRLSSLLYTTWDALRIPNRNILKEEGWFKNLVTGTLSQDTETFNESLQVVVETLQAAGVPADRIAQLITDWITGAITVKDVLAEVGDSLSEEDLKSFRGALVDIRILFKDLTPEFDERTYTDILSIVKEHITQLQTYMKGEGKLKLGIEVPQKVLDDLRKVVEAALAGKPIKDIPIEPAAEPFRDFLVDFIKNQGGITAEVVALLEAFEIAIDSEAAKERSVPITPEGLAEFLLTAVEFFGQEGNQIPVGMEGDPQALWNLIVNGVMGNQLAIPIRPEDLAVTNFMQTLQDRIQGGIEIPITFSLKTPDGNRMSGPHNQSYYSVPSPDTNAPGPLGGLGWRDVANAVWQAFSGGPGSGR